MGRRAGRERVKGADMTGSGLPQWVTPDLLIIALQHTWKALLAICGVISLLGGSIVGLLLYIFKGTKEEVRKNFDKIDSTLQTMNSEIKSVKEVFGEKIHVLDNRVERIEAICKERHD